MRNAGWFGISIRFALPMVGALLATGCAGPNPRQSLKEGYAALEAERLDDATAAADKVIAAGDGSRGPGTSEALYLKGRVLEERSQKTRDSTSARQYLDQARRLYEDALAGPPAPAPSLDAAIRAQISNIAYFQEDYATAVREGATAYPHLTNNDDKAWILYRVGISRQRLGQFKEADQLFAEVQQNYPNTEPARRAAVHQNAKAFHVQIGTYANAANAERTIAALRTDGFPTVRSVEPGTGKQIIGVGPVQTYEKAKLFQSQLQSKYPNTLILP